jgi:putative ABC transport system permease protein
MHPILHIAVRDVRRSWRHSVATLLAIAAGFVAIGLFEGYIVELRDRYGTVFQKSGMFGDVLIDRRGADEAGLYDPWASTLGPEEQAFLEGFFAESGEVTLRARFLVLSGLVTNGRSSTVFAGVGYDVAEGSALRGDVWRWNVLAGRPLGADDAGRDRVIIGRGLGNVIECRADPDARPFDDDGLPIAKERPFACARTTSLQLSTTTESGQLNAVDAEVVGITQAGFKELDLRYVAMPLQLAQRLTDTKVVSRYSVALRDPSRARRFAARLTAEAERRGLPIRAVPWREHRVAELFLRGIELLGMFRSLVMLVVLVVAAMSVFNTMAKAVSERTREIGTLRSVGFRRRHIVALFTTEAALLAVIGVATGLALVLPLVWAIGALGIRYKAGILAEPIRLTIAYDPMTYAGAAAILAAACVLAAFLPARRASRMKIPDALGHV